MIFLSSNDFFRAVELSKMLSASRLYTAVFYNAFCFPNAWVYGSDNLGVTTGSILAFNHPLRDQLFDVTLPRATGGVMMYCVFSFRGVNK
jgi:hypothetical protein